MFRTALALIATLSVIGAASQPAAEDIIPIAPGQSGDIPQGWTIVSGDWKLADGGLETTSLSGEPRILFGDESWQNYEIDLNVTFLEAKEPSRWLSVVFRAGADGSEPWSQVPVRLATSESGGMEFAARLESGWSVRLKARDENDTQLGKPRALHIVVRGTNVQASLDGRTLIDSAFCLDRATGCIGLAASGCRARFEDITIHRLPDSPEPPKRDPKPCEVVAHRGFSAIAPGNTLASLTKAIEAGADGSECDVRATKDRAIILMHDKTVDRTTDGKGKVEDLTFEQIKALDAGSWRGKKYAGEPVPTLEQVLLKHKGSGCTAIVEIKADDIAKEVVDLIHETGVLKEAAIIAFDEQVVKDCRALAPDIPCAWLSSENLSGMTLAQKTDWIATRAKDCNTDLVDLFYGMLSPELIAALNERGIGVWAWTVNDDIVMDALMHWGIASITTDRPDRVVELRKELTGE